MDRSWQRRESKFRGSFSPAGVDDGEGADGRVEEREEKSGGRELSNFAFGEGSDVPGRRSERAEDLEWLFKAEQACN